MRRDIFVCKVQFCHLQAYPTERTYLSLWVSTNVYVGKIYTDIPKTQYNICNNDVHANCTWYTYRQLMAASTVRWSGSDVSIVHPNIRLCYLYRRVLLCLSYVLLHLSYVLLRLSYVLLRLSYVLLRLSYVLLHLSYILLRLSYVLLCLSYVLQNC